MYIAKNFAKWTQRVARAITRHEDDPDAEEARRRSGQSYGKHGLSNDEEWMREDRSKSRRNYNQTVELGQQLQASKGKGKSGAAEHTGGTGSSSEAKTSKLYRKHGRSCQAMSGGGWKSYGRAISKHGCAIRNASVTECKRKTLS